MIRRVLFAPLLVLTTLLATAPGHSRAAAHPPHWGFCSDVYPGHDMLFLAKGVYAQRFCTFFTAQTISGFGRLRGINHYRYRWNAHDDTFSTQAYGAALAIGQPVVSHVCSYNYRYKHGAGVFGVYDSGGAMYGHELCHYLADGAIETGTPVTDDWS
jgi:hypothetical protein